MKLARQDVERLREAIGPDPQPQDTTTLRSPQVLAICDGWLKADDALAGLHVQNMATSGPCWGWWEDRPMEHRCHYPVPGDGEVDHSLACLRARAALLPRDEVNGEDLAEAIDTLVAEHDAQGLADLMLPPKVPMRQGETKAEYVQRLLDE